MFCHKCGTQLDKGTKFCHKCGANLNINAQSHQTNSTTQQNVPSMENISNIANNAKNVAKSAANKAKNQIDDIAANPQAYAANLKNTVSNVAKNPSKKKNKKIIFGAIAAVVLLVIIIVVATAGGNGGGDGRGGSGGRDDGYACFMEDLLYMGEVPIRSILDINFESVLGPPDERFDGGSGYPWLDIIHTDDLLLALTAFSTAYQYF